MSGTSSVFLYFCTSEKHEGVDVSAQRHIPEQSGVWSVCIVKVNRAAEQLPTCCCSMTLWLPSGKWTGMSHCLCPSADVTLLCPCRSLRFCLRSVSCRRPAPGTTCPITPESLPGCRDTGCSLTRRGESGDAQ